MKGCGLQQPAVAARAVHMPLRILCEIRDAHVDRRRGAERRRVVRVRPRCDRLERRLVSVVPPRLIDLARRRRCAEARGLQPERLEKARAQQILPCHPGRALEHRARDRIPAVAVNPVRARRLRGRFAQQAAHKFPALGPRLALLLLRDGVQILRRIMRRATAVDEQLLQRHLAPRMIHLLDIVGKNFTQRAVPADLSVLDEHRGDARRHAFRAGADVPLVIEQHRHHPARAPHPGRAIRDEFPLVHDRGRERGHVVLVADFFERDAHIVRIGMRVRKHQTRCDADDQSFHPQRKKRAHRMLQMISS